MIDQQQTATQEATVPESAALQKPPTIIDIAQKWCLTNPRNSMVIGLLFIFAGILIEDAFIAHPEGSNIFSRIHYSSVFYHLMVILGEAIIVMFFLHLFIEKTNHHENQKENKKALEENKAQIEGVFLSMINTFKTEGDKTVKALKGNLFTAILQEKMPAEIVQVILANEFFMTNFLRKKLKVEFIFKSIENNMLKIEQRISFDMQYISGKEEFMEYDMPFSLSDTPLASYSFGEANYITSPGTPSSVDHTLTKENNFKVKETGKHKEKDAYVLTNPIKIAKDETITVEQVIYAEYNLDDRGFYDSYHVNHHTIDVTIVFDLPKQFEVAVYPTFPEKYFPKVKEFATRSVYPNIAFLVPGQGFGFSIKTIKKL